MNKNVIKYTHDNRSNLVTPFDVYMSLVRIVIGNNIQKIKLYLDENKRGESLFKFIDKNDRNCEFYNKWMEKDY